MRGVVLWSTATLMILGFAAGCGSSDSGSGATTGDGGGDVTVPADSGGGTPVTVTAGDNSDVSQFLTVEPTSVQTGKVTFTFKNTGNRQHEMIVLKTDEAFDQLKIGSDDKVSEDASVGEISETDQGKTVTKTFDLTAGSYVLVCNIEKHYRQGMRSAFTVTP